MNVQSDYYRWLSIPSLSVAGLLTYLTAGYFIHGAQQLETDPWLKTLAFITVIALVAGEMVAGWMASMLSGQRFAAWCAILKAYAFFIFLMELVMVCAVQISGTLGADMAQSKLAADASILQARIEKIEARASEMDRTAAMQLADNQRKLSLLTSQQAAAEERSAQPLRDELKQLKDKLNPTFMTTMDFTGKVFGFEENSGPFFAVVLVVTRCFGMSAGALMFAMLSGSLWRRGAASSNAASPAVPAISSIPVVPSFGAPAFGAPAPAPVFLFKASPAPAPAPAAEPASPSFWTSLAASIKKMLPTWQQAAAVPAAAGAAAGVGAQPPEPPEPPEIRVEYTILIDPMQSPKLTDAPAAKPVPSPAPVVEAEKAPAIVLDQARTAAPAPAAGPAPAPATFLELGKVDVVERARTAANDEAQAKAQDDAPAPAPAPISKETPVEEPEIVLHQERFEEPEPAAPAPAPEERAAAQEPEAIAQAPAADPEGEKVVLNRERKTAKKLGPQVDTGVGENDGHRYRRLKHLVIDGLKPTVDTLVVADQRCSREVAMRYQAEMLKEGVLVRKGNRYMLAPKYQTELDAIVHVKSQLSLIEEQS